MIDPVELAGTAFDLAEWGGEILRRLYRYYIDVKEAQIRADDLRVELGITVSLLHAVSADLATETSVSLNPEVLRLALTRFRTVVEKLEARVEPKAVQGIRKLTWPFKRNENKELIDGIERCKTTLTLALNIEQK